MKLALILLSICVAISHQQYFQPRMMMGYHWMSPFVQQPKFFNYYPVSGIKCNQIQMRTDDCLV